MHKFFGLCFIFCFFLSSLTVQASKESAQAYGGDNKGVLWSSDEPQNVWRNPSQLGRMKSMIQMTRESTDFGKMEGGGFFNQKDIERILGYKFPAHFALYVNHPFYTIGPLPKLIDFDFDNFDNFSGQRVMPNGADRSARFDYFIGGFGDPYELAVRIGYEYLRPAADNKTAAPNSYNSALDFSLGFNLGPVDVYGTYGFEGLTEASANTERDNKSTHSYYEVGFRADLPSNFIFYGNLEHGSWDKRKFDPVNLFNYTLQIGLAKLYKSKNGGEFFWDCVGCSFVTKPYKTLSTLTFLHQVSLLVIMT